MELLLIITGMTIVTMIPRILPFYAFDHSKISTYFKFLLANVPYCVLGALILPGGVLGVEGAPLVSIMSLIIAGAISWRKGGIFLPIAGAVTFAIIFNLM